MAQPNPLAPNTVTISKIAHGYKIDILARHDASGDTRRLSPVHWPTLELARCHAAMIAKATGLAIEERLG